MKTRSVLPPTTSASSTSTSGSADARRDSICGCIGVIDVLPLRKKSGPAPTLGTASDARAPARKLLLENSTGAPAPGEVEGPMQKRSRLSSGGRHDAHDHGTGGSPRAPDAASTRAPAAGTPRDGDRVAASSDR